MLKLKAGDKVRIDAEVVTEHGPSQITNDYPVRVRIGNNDAGVYGEVQHLIPVQYVHKTRVRG
jgi:hypothetical protein